jgi:hypothetical protein
LALPPHGIDEGSVRRKEKLSQASSDGFSGLQEKLELKKKEC